MSTPSTSTTGDTPVPAERPQVASVDIDGELQLAELQRLLAGDEDRRVHFHGWEVERRLGSGGMGTVYLARDPKLDRSVALKVIKRGDTGDAQARSARVIREAQALARVKHDNVLQIHQVDTSASRAVIEMEYVDGPTMREWQSEPGRSWREIVAAYADAGDGLAAIHRAGLLHRDIKPDNLLVDADGRVKVADLGLAVADRSVESVADAGEARAGDQNSILALQLTADGAWVGTPGYMAPEVVVGAEASKASDQFSLAVSLWEAVYGTRPFLGESPGELAAAIENGSLAPSRHRGWRPRWLARVLRRALRFDADQRYPSVAVFVRVLRRRLALRRWLGAGATAALVIGSSSAVVWYGKPLPPDPCVDAGAEMTAVWNDDRRARLAAKAGPESVAALELLLGILDTRAATWVETRTQLCAAESRRDPEQQLMEAEVDAWQHACLRYVRVNIEAQVTQLLAATENLAHHYTVAADALERLPTCEDRGELEHWALAVPDDEVDGDLAEAQALEAAGRYREAEALARAVVERTRRRDPFRHAEALYRLGHIMGLERRERLAFETLDEARDAAFALGHDELFCAAAAFQAKYGAVVLQDAAVAARELGLADACVARVGARSPILRADLLEARGLLAQAAGEPKEAITWHEQALALRREHLGEDHRSTAKSLHNLANAIVEADSKGARADEARGLYEKSLDVRTRLLGDVHPEVADVLFDLGEFLQLSGDAEDREQARQRLERAKRVYVQASGDHTLSRTKIHLALARMDIEDSELDAAEAHLQHARSLRDDGQGFTEAERATWLHLDGALALRRKDYNHAADSSRRATRLHRRHDPRSQEALDSLVDELAADYGLGDYARIATLVRDEGEVLIEYLSSLPPIERGPLAWYVGDALARRAVWTDAATYLELAMASYEALGEADSVEQLRIQLDSTISSGTTPRKTRQ